jgi:RNA polymerase sigma-70 factor (ECF subfamily)
MHYNRLGDYILRITESKELTEEIVQDVFLKIWLNRSYMAELYSFEAYLQVVAKNHAFSCLKKIAREKRNSREWVNNVLQNATNVEKDTAVADIGNVIDKAVDLLPAQQKKVYILSRIEGLKQIEIAREMNISLETVKKHMVLALRFLKNNLRSNIGIFILFLTGFFRN